MPMTSVTSYATLARAMPVLLLSLALTACAPRQMLLGGIADSLAAQGRSTEDDLDLAREASAYHLKLSEAILRERPDHLALAETVAAGFTQYAYAFVAFDADRVEAQDARAAERLRARAARLYRRANGHAMAALETRHPGFIAALRADRTPAPRADEIGLYYWAAAAWGGWISLAKDDAEVLADLPLAIRVARAAWAVDPAWGLGALTGLLATFEAGRPGGSPSQALAWFDEAIRQSQGLTAGPLLAKAEGHALPRGDRELFERLLGDALSVPDGPDSPHALQNEVMRRRAAWLLERTDDLF